MAADPPPARPFILVLAGVNGAGKSSVLGDPAKERRLPWFHPDAAARAMSARTGCPPDEAAAAAWAEGKARLENALVMGANHAFETTLGGETISRILAQAASTHDVHMVYCGLDSVERHLARVRLRVASGGHDIPEGRVRARWTTSRQNLIALLPSLASLEVFDNSVEVAPGERLPDPVLVLKMRAGRLLHPRPDDAATLAATPGWAKPILAAALRLHEERLAALPSPPPSNG